MARQLDQVVTRALRREVVGCLDERQALPLATEELASRLVTQLSEGW